MYGDRQSGIRSDSREEFQRMIHDALAGKIDLIICKSASRWARNIADGLNSSDCAEKTEGSIQPLSRVFIPMRMKPCSLTEIVLDARKAFQPDQYPCGCIPFVNSTFEPNVETIVYIVFYLFIEIQKTCFF